MEWTNRVVIFSLRAIQSHNESKRYSHGLATYMQISFGVGFIGIAGDLVGLIRCLLVNATYGSERYPESPAAATKDGALSAPREGTPDLTRERFWVRRFTDFMGPAFLAATVLGIIANSHYNRFVDDQKQADSTAKNRVISSAMALALVWILLMSTLWGKWKLPRISKRGVSTIYVLTFFVSTIAIYRLTAMRFTTTSLSAPSNLNSDRNKLAFYVCHALPEWFATQLLLHEHIRKTFGTGLLGDRRFQDETDQEKVKRLDWEVKRAMNRGLTDAEKAANNQVDANGDGRA
ncbi:hypothetical protein B0H34DRAFT_697367 [Crassisporium funariophilum]|nr:hypothetical protein B0H34DRAFT_697367 [Crassisporium funariophilum]